jgi:hypothetical protein
MAGLHLPAMEIGSVVGEGELPIHVVGGIFSNFRQHFWVFWQV